MNILIPVFLVPVILTLWSSLALAQGPLYKSSSRDAEPIDIATDAYGGSSLAPDALKLGTIVPGFSLPKSREGQWRLGARGPITTIIFYRGHW